MKKERKCFLGFFFAIILLLATPLTASADSNDAPKKEYTREDIVSIAAKYGFTTQFIYCKTTQDVPLVNVNSLSSILEDMNATTIKNFHIFSQKNLEFFLCITSNLILI